MNKDFSERFEQFNDSIQKYIKVQLDLIKLTIIEKAAKVASFVFIAAVVVFFFLFILATGIAAFAVWYGETYNDYVEGLLLAGGGLVVLTILLIVVGRIVITGTIVKSFGSKWFKDDKDV